MIGSLPACILVLDKENAAARKGVFMIDASKGFIKDGNKNRLRAQDMHRIRVPVPDYSGSISERTYRERMSALLKADWFRHLTRATSVQSVVRQAKTLRRDYELEAISLLDSLASADRFHAKRLLPKIRYRFGRLAYLAEPGELKRLALLAEKFPALRLQSTVANAIATGDVGEVIGFGVNAVQAAAQPLRMRPGNCFIGDSSKLRGADQSLAVLSLNGIHLNESPQEINHSDLLNFARSGSSVKLMRSPEPFVAELACLHGISERPRHSSILDSAFDQAEEIALDAIEHEGQSS